MLYRTRADTVPASALEKGPNLSACGFVANSSSIVCPVGI